MKKIVGVIPARFKSKRFPGKMLFNFLNKSLIQHTFENASKAIDTLFIATDDKKIFDHAKAFGAKVIMTSENCQNGTERIMEALQTSKLLQESDIIVNIQGDHPCIKATTIKKVADAFDDEVMVVTAVSPISKEKANNPNVVKCVFDKNERALYFSRAPIPFNGPYYYHVGIYAYKKEFLLKNLEPTPLQKSEDLEQLKILEHGHKIKIVVVEEKELGVDVPEDIEKVKNYLCR